MHIPRKAPVGSLLAYEYLWSSQAVARKDGGKTYPVAIVVAREVSGPFELAYAVAISHSAPREGDRALEVPPRLKRHLGLDVRPSWVYTDELNVFAWPGPDLRPAERLSSLPQARGTCVIGHLPSDWFADLKRHLSETYRLQKLAVVRRSE
jgi:hypothetical protein